MKKRMMTAVCMALAFALSATATACNAAQNPDQELFPNNSENVQLPEVEDSAPEQAPPHQNPPESEENNGSNSSNGSTTTPPQNGGSSTGNNGNSSDNSGSNTDSSEGTVQKPVQNTTARYIVCQGDNVNLRSGAGTSYAVLGQAEKGNMYAIIGQTGNWYKTYYKNKVAYFYAEYASVLTLEKSENKKVEKVIEEGYKLLGVPYVYGAVRLHDGYGNFLSGFSLQKFDCSSLVQYAFYQGAGKILQTTTRTQFTQGKYVHPSDLSRGDCIYFTNETRQYNKGIERIGHVAIYLGNNYILHTASDYARIEKMSQQRWNFYVEARRFV